MVQRIMSSIQENCKLRTSQDHVVYKNCFEFEDKKKYFECQNKNRKQFLHTTCSYMFLTCSDLAIFLH